MGNSKIVSLILRVLHDDLQGGREEALEVFWENIEKNGSPLIEKIEGDDENYMVTLLWKATGPIDNVCAIGEMFGYDEENNKFEQLLDTNLWYRTWRRRGDAQSVYFFVVKEREGQEWDDCDFRVDPHNPNKYVCIEDEKYPDECYLISKEESYVSLPEFKESIWTIEKEDVPKGKLELFNDFESKILNNKRRVWVYTPAAYSNNEEPYGLAIFTDGWEYVHISKAPIVIDNLIAEGKIPPMCAVFIETQEEREIELTCSDKFVDLITKEILPWMHEKYNITKDREKNVIVGFSYGGLTANYTALKHPEIFAKVFCHSGGLYWKAEGDENERGLILREYEKKERLPLDFYVTFGEFEKEAEKHYKANLEFVKILERKGYNFKYEEFMGGHTYMDVKINLAKGLMHLLGI
ncbi:MAG: alpha/beta hydrolase [Clostridium sp.]|uniref:alpha/beta hydrolase n=1 Tax=Clostridium sp. TaxID=1506 RepID=UPI003D6D6711